LLFSIGERFSKTAGDVSRKMETRGRSRNKVLQESFDVPLNGVTVATLFASAMVGATR
jgi:hypothetical protein